MSKPSLPDLPWITRDGIDITKFPLESNFKAALSPNRQRAFNSIRVLQLASHHCRVEASVFLTGLLVNLPPEDWEMRSVTVDGLRHTHTERCAVLLFSELRRVRSANAKRRYIDMILVSFDRFLRSSSAMNFKLSPTTNPSLTKCATRAHMTCVETISMVFGPRDSGLDSQMHRTQFPLVETYTISEWSSTIIRAEAHPRAADLEIRISIPDQFVERISRETSARGANDANPTPAVWVLE